MRAFLLSRRQRIRESTLVTQHSVCSAFFTWCVEQGYCASNPMRQVPKPRQRAPEHRYVPADGLRRLYNACADDYDRLLILLLAGCGLRNAELRNLRRRDIDQAAGTIRVLGKGKKWRTLAPGAAAMTLLAALPEGDRVFPWSSPNAVRYRVRAIARRAGLGHVTVHMLRHSFAVAFLEESEDAFTLQTLLGHASSRMTAYYVRAVRERAALRRQVRIDLAERLFVEHYSPVPAPP